MLPSLPLCRAIPRPAPSCPEEECILRRAPRVINLLAVVAPFFPARATGRQGDTRLSVSDVTNLARRFGAARRGIRRASNFGAAAR